MSLRRVTQVFTASFLLFAGIWLVFATATPAPESAQRQRALRSMAPAGVENEQTSHPIRSQTIEPVVVDLKEIEPNIYDTNNQYDRWLQGEIDLAEHESMLSEAEITELQAAARELSPIPAIQTATERAEGAAPSSLLAFDSLDYNECCGGGGNVPPDPELAAGPNYLVAAVNVAFEIYDKSGVSLVGPVTFSSFMGENPNCASGVFDPNALYDESADRFILGIDGNGDYYCVAVSATPDPTGSWFVYALPTDLSPTEFFDYPHAGVGQDAIYMGANIFDPGFLESRIYALDKSAMYAGSGATMVQHSLANIYGTPQPLNLHGWNQGTWPSGGPHYILADENYNGSTFAVFSWGDPFGANTLAKVGTIDLNAYTGVAAGYPLDVPQRGSAATLQANDWRPQDFEYRNGYGWMTTTIACNPGSGSVNCVRWAQIDPTTATIVDAGVFGSNGDSRTFADLAVNHCNDMAIGYTKSNTRIFPAIWYTGRRSTDAPGILQTEAELKAGELAYTAFDVPSPHRWGDYTGMTIDPDGFTFWYLGEYSKNTGNTSGLWGTYIGAFSYGNSCGAPPAPNDDIDNATQIVSNSYNDSQDTSGATVAQDDPIFPCGSGDTGSETVWYELNLAQEMQVYANTFLSDYDTMLALWSGSRGALTNKACNNDFGGMQSEIDVTVPAGIYYLEVAELLVNPPVSRRAVEGGGKEIDEEALFGGNLNLSVELTPALTPVNLTVPDLIPVSSGKSVDVSIVFTGTGENIASLTLSVDFDESCLSFDPVDGDGDGNPDNVIFTLPAPFNASATYEPGDLDGEIDIFIADSFPPLATLPDGKIADLRLDATCVPAPLTTTVAPVNFSTDPAASAGNTSGQSVSVLTDSGSVEINPLQLGDCNGDGVVDAGDISACVLEIFDGDGGLPADAPGGTFPGKSTCDANQDGIIDAGDIICTILIIFGGPDACGSPTSVISAETESASLSLVDGSAAQRGGMVQVPLYFSSQGHEVAAATFSLTFDPAHLRFDGSDGNGDGIPDGLAFNLPDGFDATVPYAASGRIDVVVADVAPPLMALPDGVLGTLTFGSSTDMAQSTVRFDRDGGLSMGNRYGVSIPVTATDGTVYFQSEMPSEHRFFLWLPLINR